MRSTLVIVLCIIAPCLLAPSAGAALSTVAPSGASVEITRPAERPRGTLITIHGGGWLIVGPHTIGAEGPLISTAVEAGWRTVDIDYGAGVRSLPDVISTYDWVRRRYGSRETVCAGGSSAGGHLSLMLAARRPSLACVIGLAAPTDLSALRIDGPNLFRDVVQPLFADRLRDWSPTTYARTIRARVLLATSVDDVIVPIAQQRRYLALDEDARGLSLRRGATGFAHAPVSAQEFDRLNRAIRRLLGETIVRAGSAPSAAARG